MAEFECENGKKAFWYFNLNDGLVEQLKLMGFKNLFEEKRLCQVQVTNLQTQVCYRWGYSKSRSPVDVYRFSMQIADEHGQADDPI